MTDSSSPVGVFVTNDNYCLVERLVEPGANVHINNLTLDFALEIFVGESRYLEKRKPRIKSCFVLTEPPEIKRYSEEFLDSFDFIAGPKFSYLKNRKNFIVSNPIIPFFVGVNLPTNRDTFFTKMIKFLPKFKENTPNINFSLSELLAIDIPKSKSLSVIVSSKTLTPQQRDRVNFIKYLERNSSVPIQISGGFSSPIPDKFSVLAKSTHHLAIENSNHHDYWTEKLSDSILSLNFTFYSGAPNIDEYFHPSILKTFSLSNFKEAQGIIESYFFDYPVDINLLKHERLKLIHEYSLMNLVRRIVAML